MSFDRIFQQEQIARVVESRVVVCSVGNMQLIPLDAESEKLTQKIEGPFQKNEKVRYL